MRFAEGINVMNYRDGVITTAINFVAEKGIQVEVREMDEDVGIARFNPDRGYIELNAGAIIRYSNELGIPLNDYIIINLCHELGHFLDDENLFDVNRISNYFNMVTKDGLNENDYNDLLNIRYNLEKRAIDIGRTLIPSYLLEEYNEINQSYLSTIKEREMRSVEHLTELLIRKYEIESGL